MLGTRVVRVHDCLKRTGSPLLVGHVIIRSLFSNTTAVVRHATVTLTGHTRRRPLLPAVTLRDCHTVSGQCYHMELIQQHHSCGQARDCRLDRPHLTQTLATGGYPTRLSHCQRAMLSYRAYYAQLQTCATAPPCLLTHCL